MRLTDNLGRRYRIKVIHAIVTYYYDCDAWIDPPTYVLVFLVVFFHQALVQKPEGKRPLGRPRCRWVDNIKMDLLEVGWGGVDWIGLAQDRDKRRALVNAVMNL
jgi:hypothetical protein